MNKHMYRVGVSVTPDGLGGPGYVAEVVAGHRKVLNLFAFGDDKESAVAGIAARVAEELTYSHYDLSEVAVIAVYTPKIRVFSLKTLGFSAPP